MSYIPALHTNVVQGSVPFLHQGPPIITQRVVQGQPRLIQNLSPVFAQVQGSPLVPLIQAQTVENFGHIQTFPLFQVDQNMYTQTNLISDSFHIYCERDIKDPSVYICKFYQ